MILHHFSGLFFTVAKEVQHGTDKKRHYDRYTLAFKVQAVKLANHPGVMEKDIAESLDIHPVMLYRWRMEFRHGEL